MKYVNTALIALLLCAGCGAEQPQQPAAPQPTTLPAEATQALADALPPESDLPPMNAGTWSLACGAALELEAAGPLQLLERAGLRPLGGQAMGAPALDEAHRRIAWSHAPVARPETVVSVTSCDGDSGWGEPRTIVEGAGSPDRVAISPDGAWVVWVSGASGVAALWAAPFGGGDPVQLTSRGVDRSQASPGSPPTGFVAPPHQGPPTVVLGDDGTYRAVWQTPDGEHSVELPR